jgi:hypothetical protein
VLPSSVASCSDSLDAPIKDIVVLEAFSDEEITEELAEVQVIRLVVEAERTRVVQEDSEFVRESAAQKIGGGCHLLLHDVVVLLLLGGSLETLPRESAAKEVHKHVGNGFQVITTGLFDTQVSVDRRVPSSSGKILVLPVGDVKVGLGVTELLGKSMTLTWLPRLPMPIKKLSGLMSRWMKLWE